MKRNVIFLEVSYFQNFTNTHSVLKVEVSECKKKLILVVSNSPNYKEFRYDHTPESINLKGKSLVTQYNRWIVDDVKFSSGFYSNKHGLCIAKTDENGFIEICSHEEDDPERL